MALTCKSLGSQTANIQFTKCSRSLLSTP